MTGLLSRLSPRRRRLGQAQGFSLVELLLVLALIGIISAIAIPAYLGQRQRARVIGDAMSNAKALQMALESRKAENGVYAAAGTYGWNSDGSGTGVALVPSFQPKGNSIMNYSLTVDASGLTYTLSVQDPSLAGSPIAYQIDQSGQVLKKM